MYALTTLFDFAPEPAFARIWHRLKINCDLVTAHEASYVHLSWQGALNYHLEPVHDALREIGNVTPGFQIQMAGMGIFTGKDPVLYLNIVKNRELMSLQELLWEKLYPFAVEMNAYYAPQAWVPHVTLTYGKLSPADLACAVQELMYEPFGATLKVDHLAMIFMRDGKVGIDSRFELQP